MNYLLPFNLSFPKKSSAKMTSFGGIPLVLETWRALGLNTAVERNLHLKERGWAENSILEGLISLQVAGGECMDDIKEFGEDDVIELCGYDAFPSSSSVRRFLHIFDEGMSGPRIAGQAIVPKENEALLGLNELYKPILEKMLNLKRPRWITLDVDATVVFSEKDSCLPTYKGGTGYQPIVGIWAEKNMIIADEFRDGNVPASFGALRFLKKCEANLPKLPLMIRSDGAWYQHDILSYCSMKSYAFSVTADLSQGFMRFVHAVPENEWRPLFKMTDKGMEATDREYAELSFSTASLPQAEIRRRMLAYRYIVTRKKSTQADLFEGEYHYEGIVTNMNWNAMRLIWWHYERAGRIEQVIDIIKNDLAGGKFPCGTFGANAAWWRIACIAHNIVQCLKIVALPFSWFYARMKRLRFKLYNGRAKLDQKVDLIKV
jgi:hypothetical protein